MRFQLFLWVCLGCGPALADAWPGPERFSPASEVAQAAGRKSDLPAEALRIVRQAPVTEPAALLTEGMALYRLGRFRPAAQVLDQAAKRVHAVDVADFFAAESHFHAGNTTVACRRYSKFEAKHPISPWRHRVRFRIADCALALGNAQTARDHLVLQLKRYPEFPFLASAYWMLADAEAASGKRAESAGWLRKLVRAYPNDPLAKPAKDRITALEASGVEPPAVTVEANYQLGYELRRRKYLTEALVTLKEVVEHPEVPRALRIKASYQTGRALLQLERFESALKNFTQMHRKQRGSWRKTALYWKSRTLERLGRIEKAAEALMASRGSVKSPSAETRFKTAWVYFNGAHYKTALAFFDAAAEASRELRSKSIFWITWLNFRLGRYKTAIKGFERLQRGSKWRAARYAYWAARSMVKIGRLTAAKRRYKWAIERAPTSYYAYQAAARLAELEAPPIEKKAADEKDRGDSKGDAGAPAPATDGATKGPAGGAPDPAAAAGGGELPKTTLKPAPTVTEPPEPPPPLTALKTLTERWGGAFPALLESYELAVAGERRWAALRLRRVSDEIGRFRRSGKPRSWRFTRTPYVDYRKDEKKAWEWGRRRGGPDREAKASRARRDFLAKKVPDDFWRLMRDAFISVGDEHYARRHAMESDAPKGKPEGKYNARYRLRYPRAYRSIVEDAARRHRLDPYFIWALMTVESSYNPWAISRASARGLMQVMPHTGGLIGDRMAWRNFGTALLFEPEVVIEMAAWYFRQLLDKFNGQLPLAIASYNAGPHRVAAWLGPKGHLPMDEFIEEIPYNEAREYTKKVLRYLALYRRIYEGGSGFDVPQRVDTAFQDNINF